MAYIDLDDVLADTCSLILQLSLSLFGISKKKSELVSFDLRRMLGVSGGSYDDFMSELHAEDNLLSIQPVKGAVQAIRGIADAFHIRIYIVTGRPYFTEAATCEWLKRESVPFDGILFVDKYMRYPKDVKAGRSLLLEDLSHFPFLFAVEDSLSTADYLAGRLGINTFLLAQPWNAVCRTREMKQIRLGRDWGELQELVSIFLTSYLPERTPSP